MLGIKRTPSPYVVERVKNLPNNYCLEDCQRICKLTAKVFGSGYQLRSSHHVVRKSLYLGTHLGNA